MALDLMVKTLVSSPQFRDVTDKNWTGISKLIPGTTPRQCQRRYEELVKANASVSSYALTLTKQTSAAAANSKTNRGESDAASEVKGSRPSSAKVRGSRQEKDGAPVTKLKTGHRPDSGDQGPVMVIHVCDEAKNLKQDFHCPRDLLVREMKYFAEYLSTDAQRWEEVDISVHCDVQIFDWLMRHVKRGTKEATNVPRLEPTNVISILISSDFLKMDNLVQECVKFCHQNMSSIVATPCNMNCINDRLVGNIADLFNHNEADDIKDRKDKFKSKLFAKMVERLFDATTRNRSSPESAATLFKCSICKKLLTKSSESRVKCLPSRVMVNRQGNLCFTHLPDAAWEVNDHLLELKSQLKNWRDVYWRLWGTVNCVTCARCGDVIPCVELGHCRYHLDPAKFDTESTATPSSAVGTYPCCGTAVLRFDPLQPNRGCKVRDHVVSVPAPSSAEAALDPHYSERVQVHDDLLAHRDAISLPASAAASVPSSTEEGEPNIFGLEEQVVCSKSKDGAKVVAETPGLEESKSDLVAHPKPRLQALTIERQVSFDDEFGFGESDDEVGDDEDLGKGRKSKTSRRVTVDPKAILLDAPDFSTTKMRKWDSSRSMRWNQDAQREEDHRRMKEMVNYLTRLRISAEKIDKLKHKEYAGGIFAKLEAQWKAANAQPPKPTNPQFRNKPRLSQLVGK